MYAVICRSAHHCQNSMVVCFTKAFSTPYAGCQSNGTDTEGVDEGIDRQCPKSCASPKEIKGINKCWSIHIYTDKIKFYTIRLSNMPNFYSNFITGLYKEQPENCCSTIVFV